MKIFGRGLFYFNTIRNSNSDHRDDVIIGDEHMCLMTQSPAQLMYNLYNLVALTDIKGFAIIQFSYMILKINKAEKEVRIIFCC